MKIDRIASRYSIESVGSKFLNSFPPKTIQNEHFIVIFIRTLGHKSIQTVGINQFHKIKAKQQKNADKA